MKRPVKHHPSIRRFQIDARAKALAATAAFLMLSLLFVFGIVRLFGLYVDRELSDPIVKVPSTAAPIASSTPFPTPESQEAVSGAVVNATDTPVSSAAIPASNTPIPGVSGPSAPAPTAAPPSSIGATAFHRGRMDLTLLGFDENGCLDAAALMAIRNRRCTFIFIPKNLIDGSGQPLSRLRSAKAALLALETVLPVDFKHYVFLKMGRLAQCVDALGGVTVSGNRIDGAAATELSRGTGSDELIRISKLQSLVIGTAAELRSVSLLRLAGLKSALNGLSGGNLAGEQYLLLFAALRALDVGDYEALLLPVDSVSVDGLRCYQADAPIAAALMRRFYHFE